MKTFVKILIAIMATGTAHALSLNDVDCDAFPWMCENNEPCYFNDD